MGNLDLTTIYSAQAALEHRKLNQKKYAWFVYSLASLSSALIHHQKVYLSRPPRSKEANETPPGSIAQLLRRAKLVPAFQSATEQEKNRAISGTRSWLEENRNHFSKLKSNSKFWKMEELQAWLKWHDRYEFISHDDRLGGITGEEFRDFIVSLGAKNDYEKFTFDVLARGFYYWTLNSGNIWLHPVRTFYLPGDIVPNKSDEIRLDQPALALLLGALHRFGRKLDFQDRSLYWLQLVKDVRTMSRKTGILSPDLPNQLSYHWKIPKWEMEFERIIAWLDGVLEIFEPTLVFNVPESQGVEIHFKFLKPLMKPIKSEAQILGSSFDNVRTNRTQKIGKRILFLASHTRKQKRD